MDIVSSWEMLCDNLIDFFLKYQHKVDIYRSVNQIFPLLCLSVTHTFGSKVLLNHYVLKESAYYTRKC